MNFFKDFPQVPSGISIITIWSTTSLAYDDKCHNRRGRKSLTDIKMFNKSKGDAKITRTSMIKIKKCSLFLSLSLRTKEEERRSEKISANVYPSKIKISEIKRREFGCVWSKNFQVFVLFFQVILKEEIL